MIEKLEKVLEPFANKLAQQRHLQAISSGMMMPLGLIVIGSLFLIVANPPINLDLVDLHTGNIFLKALIGWKQFAVANYDVLTLPYNYTMGLVGLISAFGIAYCLAESYQMKSAVYGIIAMCTFLMVSAPLKDGGISTSFLGADGLFVAIIIALVSVEISRFVSQKLVISFPGSVPSAVTDFVNSLLPLAANIIIIYGLNVALMAATGKNLPNFIMSILTPAISGVDNIWMFMGIYLFSNILWLFGINGSSIVFPIVFALCIANTGVNAEKIPIINTNIKATTILTKIPHENIFGGIPINNTENRAPSTNIRNPLVTNTTDLYLAAYSIYGPSITSDFALIIENGYSFNRIMYPMKNTIAAIAPDTVNKNGPLAC